MRLGIAEGPQVGTWLRRAYDAQLEEQFADRETLLAWLETEIRKEEILRQSCAMRASSDARAPGGASPLSA